jgi:hypothetical protein
MAVVIAKSVGLSCGNGVLKLKEAVDEPLSVTLVIDGEVEVYDLLIEDTGRTIELLKKLMRVTSKKDFEVVYGIEGKKQLPGIRILN